MIFISYRRDEIDAGRLTADLAREFGDAQVFRDVDNAHELDGRPFADVLDARIAGCRAFVAVIGPVWKHRMADLANPQDWVRMEIASALGHDGVKVLPVLTGGVAMPRHDDLPEDIRRIASLGAIPFNDLNWKTSLARLLAQMPRRGGVLKWALAGGCVAVVGLAIALWQPWAPAGPLTIADWWNGG